MYVREYWDRGSRLTPDYDSIKFDRFHPDSYCFLYCYSNNEITVYLHQESMLKLIEKDVRAIQNLSVWYNIYQYIKYNKLYCKKVDDKGIITDYDPNYKHTRLICGLISKVGMEINNYPKIHLDITTNYPIKMSHINDSVEALSNSDMSLRIDLSSIVQQGSIRFLNDSEKFGYIGIDDFQPGVTPLTFIEKIPNSKYNIIEIDTSNGLQKRILLKEVNKIYKPEYFKPFMYQKGNLYGFYPLNKKAKYLFIASFNGNYARFILTNKKQGWLSVDGIEYLDE